MEFEELLCPSIFTGKKKYAGLVYESKSKLVKKSVTQSDILLRGIDFIKSQYPTLIKELGYKTIIDIVDHFNKKLLQTNSSSEYRKFFQDSSRDSLNEELVGIVQTNY